MRRHNFKFRLEASKDKATLLQKALSKKSGKNDLDIAEILTELIEKLNDVDDNYDSDDDSESDEDSYDSLKNSNMLNAVVRIYCTHSQPSFSMPWQRTRQDFSTSTGFIIQGRRILTNAHALEYSSLIQVKKRNEEKKYVATAMEIGHECDLAILTIDDDNFWRDLQPLEFGEVPNLFEDVSVVGYPIGGESISITSGVVSRIEMQEYAHASIENLAIQVDAAINGGNSGGPLLNNEGKVVGVAFQSLSDNDIENVGYAIPSTVVNHFLTDFDTNGYYSGLCAIGVRLQGIENNELRKYLKMESDDTGVLVLSVAPLAPASKMLQKGDVILSVDNIRIANDGSIPFREGENNFIERVNLNYYFTQRFAADIVEFEIIREGKRLKVKTELYIPKPLVPRVLLQRKAALLKGDDSGSSINGCTPSYLIVGGLVFITLNMEYLISEFDTEHMNNFEHYAEDFRLLGMCTDTKKEADEEVILLSQVIAHQCNIGYEMSKNIRLRKVNDIEVKSLKQVKDIVDNVCSLTTSVPLVFEFSNDYVIVLDNQTIKKAQDQILKEHFIPSYYSF